MTDQGSVGTVAVLRRYPVKSMLGENLRACEVTGRGLTGDRVLGLVHRETGKVASAKNPRLWRSLLRLSAASGPDVKIAFPDGTSMAATDPGIDAALSEFLGHNVTLTDDPPSDATLDRADPEQVLRDGMTARVRVETLHMGDASPGGTFFAFARQDVAREMIELWHGSTRSLAFRFGYYDNHRTPHLLHTYK